MSHPYETRSKSVPSYSKFRAPANSTSLSFDDTLSDSEDYTLSNRTLISPAHIHSENTSFGTAISTPDRQASFEEIFHPTVLIMPNENPNADTTLQMALTTTSDPLLPKFKSPPTFDPLTDNPILFLQSYNRAATYNGWNNVNKLRLFGTFLRGSAQDWLEDYKSDPANGTKTWEAVQLDFKTQFNADDALEDLRDELDNRKQKDQESPLEYYNEIYKLCKIVDNRMSDTEINRILKRGLKPKYQTLLIQMGKKTNTAQELQELMKKFNKLDLLEHSSAPSTSKRANTPALTIDNPTTSKQSIFNTRTPTGRIRCYNCNRQGHYARSCSQPLNQRLQRTNNTQPNFRSNRNARPQMYQNQYSPGQNNSRPHSNILSNGHYPINNPGSSSYGYRPRNHISQPRTSRPSNTSNKVNFRDSARSPTPQRSRSATPNRPLNM